MQLLLNDGLALSRNVHVSDVSLYKFSVLAEFNAKVLEFLLVLRK